VGCDTSNPALDMVISSGYVSGLIDELEDELEDDMI
jgi:hypothetical protein